MNKLLIIMLLMASAFAYVPNLIVSDIDVGDGAYALREVEIIITLKNIGDGACGRDSWVEVNIGPDGPHRYKIGNIGQSQTKELIIPYTWGFSRIGSIETITASADTDTGEEKRNNVLAESNEEDNYREKIVEVKEYISAVVAIKTIVEEEKIPNLEVESLVIDPEKPINGEEVRIEVTIQNTGNADSSDFTVGVSSSEHEQVQQIIPSLVALTGRSKVELLWTFSPGVASITVDVDTKNNIDESNEQDNSYESKFVVYESEPEPTPVEDALVPKIITPLGDMDLDFKPEKELFSWNKAGMAITGIAIIVFVYYAIVEGKVKPRRKVKRKAKRTKKKKKR